MMSKLQKALLSFVFILIASQTVYAQCTGIWEQVFFESFEYTTVIPGVVPGSIYHNTPQTHAPGIHSGNRHFYLNFVNGYAGPAYDISHNVCVGSTTRISFWFKDTWGASNNFDVNIYDGNNVLLQNQNFTIPNNNTWNQFVSNEIAVTTATIRLEIVNNLVNGGGNDLTIDDVSIEVCSQTMPVVNELACNDNSTIQLKDFIPAAPAGGVWTGPSATTNGDLGSVNLSNGVFGQYNYSVGGVAPCPSVTYPVNLQEEMGVDAGQDAAAFYCDGTIGSDLFDLLNTTNQTGFWEGPSALANAHQGTFDPNLNIAGNYEYIVLSTNSCPNDTARVVVSMDGTAVNLGNDTTICQGENLTLNAGMGYDYYLWSTNANTSSIQINAAGTYSVEVGTLGGNLVQNGDFEQGDTGFSTDYTVGTGGAWGQLSNPATYAINTSASNVHNNFPPCTDHTSGNGNFMIVNGSDVLNTNTWCQTIPVQPNTNYQFSAWLTSVSPDNPADIQFSINGIPLGNIFNAPSITCNWEEFFIVWNSGSNTSATICLLNQSIAQGGNDYGIDDITFRPICVATDDIEVAVQSLPIVDLGGDQTICENDNLVLDAGNPGLNFQWQDNSTNQTFNAFNSGIYSVTVTDAFNCSNSDQMELLLETLPNAGNDSLVSLCESEGTFNVSSMIQPGAAHDDWYNINNTVDFNPLNSTLDLSGGTSYNLANIDQGIECVNDTAFYTINVEVQPNAGIDHITDQCNDQVLDLNTLLEPGVTNGVWQEVSASGQFNAALGQFDMSGLADGTYDFEYVIDAISPCVQDIATISVNVVAVPEPNFSSLNLIGCAPYEVQFDYEGGQGNYNCTWDFGDNNTVEGCGDISHTYQQPGVYDVSLTIVNAGLCSNTLLLQDYIQIENQPVAFFTYAPNTIYSSEPEVTFTNESIYATNYLWDFGYDNTTSTSENPIYSYPQLEAGIYDVMLYAMNDIGCIDSFSLNVTVVDEIIFYVPNSFTPDNDNYNQVFQPIMTSGYQEEFYTFKVYNRWGELLFETNDSNVGWDGTYKGKLVQDGTYVWTIYFKEKFNDKKHEYRGHVTMIR